MNRKAYLVFTTINIPKIAEDFCRNFEKFGHQSEFAIIIIGDKKSSDSESFVIAEKLQKEGFDVEYFDIEKQEKWLKRFPKFKEIVPYNSDNRRNVGYLMALEKGGEVLISVDDDNYPLGKEDFFEHYNIIKKKQKLPVVKTNSNWFNVCDLLEKSPDLRIYPRGFPYSKRWKDTLITKEERKISIKLNAGLWIGDPDIDSITRINQDIKTAKFIGKHIALDIGTWSPINTQNTSLDIELLSAYYFFPMGEKIDNFIIERYGDIWAGLFLKKVMDNLGYYVSFGNPIANHIRNKHNLFKDLEQECGSIVYTDLLVEALENIKLKGENIMDLYGQLSDKFLDYVLKSEKFSDDFKKYAKKLNYNQEVWLETIQEIKK